MSRGTTLRSNQQIVDELRTAPESWVDTAIVVAFENRFEFVPEDHPDAIGGLNSLLEQGGLAVGLAGVEPTLQGNVGLFSTRLFTEYASQAWAHRYMDMLRGIVRKHSAM